MAGLFGIDLFAGAGAFSTGARQAGITVRYAIEQERYAAAAYRRNHPDCALVEADVRAVSGTKLRGFRESLPADARLVLFGGPPCQGFSLANMKTRGRENVGNGLFMEFVRAAKWCLPDYVVFENVRHFAELSGGRFLKGLQESLGRLGYRTAWDVLNAAQHGVPQVRRRFFLVGARAGAAALPAPATGPVVTVEEAIGDLPTLQNGAGEDWLAYRRDAVSAYARELRGDMDRCSGHLVSRNAPKVLRRYPHIPQGGNWTAIPKRLREAGWSKNTHTYMYRRLRSEQPSPVILNYRKSMLVHPVEDRGLSVREAARLQSVPDSQLFVGSIGFQQQQVSDGVPPALARAVFHALTGR